MLMRIEVAGAEHKWAMIDKHGRTNDDDVINRRYLSLYIKDWKKNSKTVW
jgi:hypothetical protein